MSVACVSFCVLWEKGSGGNMQMYLPELVNPRRVIHRHKRTRSSEELFCLSRDLSGTNLIHRRSSAAIKQLISATNDKSCINTAYSGKKKS